MSSKNSISYRGVDVRSCSRSFCRRGMQYIDFKSLKNFNNDMTIRENLKFLGVFFNQKKLSFVAVKYFKFFPEIFDEKFSDISEAEKILFELTPLFMTPAKLWIIKDLPSVDELGEEIYSRIAHLIQTKAYEGKGIVLYTTENDKPLKFDKEIEFVV